LKTLFARRFANPLLAALLLWCALSAARELYSSWWLATADPWAAEAPSTWRLGSNHVERLAGFLRRVELRLPAGSVVAFSSNPGPDRERFFRYLWCAFLLPEQQVLTASASAYGVQADFWIAYGTRLSNPTLEVLYESFEGTLYQIRTADD